MRNIQKTMKKTFIIYSFGCRVNEAEKVQIQLGFEKKGFTYDEKAPSIGIINTCAVTAKAEREARQLIYKLKKKGLGKLIITGCSATYWMKTKSLSKLPVDLCIENTNKDYLVDLVVNRFFCTDSPCPNNGAVLESAPDKFLRSGRLMLKIQDGCHRFCSYCIVPYLRGTPKSFSIHNLESKIHNYQNPISEVIFTAINTEAFGKDTGESLTDLIQTIIDKTNVPRISFGSIHPWSITPEFMRWYGSLKQKDRFVHFFHIPLQSGTNKTLSLMKRGYTTEEFIWKINEIHKTNPFAFIATDVIVGFLDESESDFETTYSFLEKSPISKFHVFRFSKREKTAAYYMAKRLKEPTSEEKKKRSKALIELSNRKYYEFLVQNIGRKSLALHIGAIKDGYQEALLDNQIPVYVKTNKNLNGTIQKVKVIEVKEKKLFGTIDKIG